MTSDDITITHHLTGKGTGQLTAGQQQQLAALVPSEATTKLRTEDGGVLTAAKWTWTATWTADVDKEWRDEPRNAYYAEQREAWSTIAANLEPVDPRPAPGGLGSPALDQGRFVEWAARQLDTSPEDVKHHFYVADEDGRFALVARSNPGDIADGTSIARELWKIARDGADPEGYLATNLLATRHHKPATRPTMADGKTPRCQAVSDGTHGYIDGDQCRRVANHSTLQNIVRHYYRRQPKTTS